MLSNRSQAVSLVIVVLQVALGVLQYVQKPTKKDDTIKCFSVIGPGELRRLPKV